MVKARKAAKAVVAPAKGVMKTLYPTKTDYRKRLQILHSELKAVQALKWVSDESKSACVKELRGEMYCARISISVYHD